ncbi:unnamed protein product [Chondrus crispus]|uniref:Membrane insertase YidC/Oxa/ALB C-terminal domain-containing protein n=1 Tax=Chondrus crispus TaxID=2769 RepID=R7Q3M2_CHOCR|nr:unnamed protein product [Chondrus crispus]CDF32070.1 unnamed protein product [Chondrus crispus]|eukprot:XP_005711735.1 unnamed protein product [Chondrus crispus]
MNHAILRQLPRLAASVIRPRSSAFAAHRPAATRFFSSTPARNVESPGASKGLGIPPIEPPTKAPEPLTSTPLITDSAGSAEVITAASDAAPSLTDVATSADAIAVEAVAPWSDTLLQPAVALLHTVHDVTGLPWWLAIGVSTIAIRSLLLPATLMTMRNSARMTALKPDIEERRNVVMEAVRSGDRPLAAKRQKEMQDFMRNAGATPLKVLAGPLVQFPVFISFFVGLKRLSQSDPTFATEGAMWFIDLSSKDPMFVLPVVCGASLLAMTELGGDTGSTQMSKEMRLGMRCIAALSVPMTYWFPTAVFCYWIPNNVFSIMLGAALRTKPTRQMLGLNVDVSKIPGTKAARALEAKLAAEGKGTLSPQILDPTLAVASYARSSSVVPNAQTVKPVLLKRRPKKKVKATID